jgi:hypothetical protein
MNYLDECEQRGRVSCADNTNTLLRIPKPVLDVGGGGYDGYTVFGISYYLLAETLYGGRHGKARVSEQGRQRLEWRSGKGMLVSLI